MIFFPLDEGLGTRQVEKVVHLLEFDLILPVGHGREDQKWCTRGDENDPSSMRRTVHHGKTQILSDSKQQVT